ncbi:MAG TPA: YbhB/YbcL family Raf kinase inhibitor-like protein [Sphingomicrobium sp.]|jgi:Raf kinase inhibitor-like YbhB/YbcL family protein|nr:YbhB/YbcL family Raf kinase inhibitor-like protein [Sphingomicrobium sp.]
MAQHAVVRIAPALVLAALASCGAGDRADHQANGGEAVENATLAKLQLTSDAFRDGQPIPAQFTCDGSDQTPALHWSDPPPQTKSFAMVVDDPDAPSGTFRHWGVFNIPASARSIGGGERVGTEVTNDFGKPGYGGPCPPKGHGVHHYHFKLFALDVDKLGLSAGAKVEDVEDAARTHALAQGELVGTYERK